MEKNIYAKCLGASDLNSVIELFHNTIIDTNRGHKFFVDWEKIRRHAKRFRIECSILDTLIGSKNFDYELGMLLSKYPEVLPVIPILIAVRDSNLRVINDFVDADSDIITYCFSERDLSPDEIRYLVEFFGKTGLKLFFESLASYN